MGTDKKKRNSNIELLRICLILMVMLGHANMWFIGGDYKTETEHWIKITVQTLCNPAVNGFVLISGWFGINGDYRRLFPLLFQLAVITLPICAYFSIIGEIDLLSIDGIFNYVFGGNNYWFITDYIALILFAPILNVIVENAEQRVLKTVLISTYALIVPFDVLFRSTVLGVEGGFSLLWFIWLYLFARYLKIYGWDFANKHRRTLLIICVILQTILLYLGLIGARYTNPLVLVPSACMLLVFKDFEFQNKIVNYIAPATLIAYMLHMQPCLVPYIRSFLSNLYKNDGYYLYIIEVLGLIVVLYIVAVVIYRLQKGVWKYVRV